MKRAMRAVSAASRLLCNGSKPAQDRYLHASEELKRTLVLQVTSEGIMGQCADCRTFCIATLCHHVPRSSWNALTRRLPRKSLRLIVADAGVLEPIWSESFLFSAARDKMRLLAG